MAKINCFLYYGATARHRERGVIVGLGIYARNGKEAQERYKECLLRHPELEAVPDPGIAPGGGDDELYTPEIRAELEQYHSAVI